jgi:hypothetical protein
LAVADLHTNTCNKIAFIRTAIGILRFLFGIPQLVPAEWRKVLIAIYLWKISLVDYHYFTIHEHVVQRRLLVRCDIWYGSKTSDIKGLEDTEQKRHRIFAQLNQGSPCDYGRH